MSDHNLSALNDLAQVWGSWMWSMSWQLTLLVAALLVLDRLLAGHSARLRYMLWVLVLVRLLVPPTFTAPTAITWWLSDWMVAVNSTITSRLDDLVLLNAWSPGFDNQGLHRNEAGGAEGVHSTIAHTNLHTAHGNILTWTCTLFLIWSGILAARLAILAYAWMQVRKWLRSAQEIKDPQALAILEKARLRVGVRRTIGLFDSQACSTPLVTGWFRPVILLPGHVRASLDPVELETVLVHELTHIVRGDGWIRLGQALLSCVYFYHPALWLANLFLARTCEDACDEQTIAALAGQRRSYAEAIFKVAAVVGYEPPHLAMGMLTDRYPVKRRLRRILDPQLQFAHGGGVSHWSIACLAAMLLLPSGLPITLATGPDQVTLDEVGSYTQQVYSETPSDKSLDTPADEQADSSAIEARALAQLDSSDFDERMTAYTTLERVGTLRALDRLEMAFLKRGSLEQDAAKRALDAVWRQISQSSEFSASSRLIQEN